MACDDIYFSNMRVDIRSRKIDSLSDGRRVL